MKISKEEANYLTEATQLQSKSLLWFEHRYGRLAARYVTACAVTSFAGLRTVFTLSETPIFGGRLSPR